MDTIASLLVPELEQASGRRPLQPLWFRFVDGEVLNTRRHTAALRPFRRDEFGDGPARPSEAHIQAANSLIQRLRQPLVLRADYLAASAGRAAARPNRRHVQALLLQKERADRKVKQIEKIWNFYFELFGQRQSLYADWLLATDRIAQDCYQALYTGIDSARSVPSPPPFSYMETGLTPATFRRGIRLTRLGRRTNPFPIVKLPYHRLVNPWTLGAVHHEVSHNLQNDVGLWGVVPRRIERRLRAAGLDASVARLWARWHKEIWADLCALLLGGPAIVASLVTVLARSPASTLRFNPGGVHPTPYLRTLINLELLERMGFDVEAGEFRELWRRLYPTPGGKIPEGMLQTFPQANRLVVDTICFQPYAQFGGKSLAGAIRFKASHQEMVREAGERIAAGTDPGIIPARFLVGATRWAVEEKLATPERVTRNFYEALVRR